MTLFARLADLVTANLHALVDRVEDPELLLAHLIRELEEGLALVRQQAARALAADHRLRRELEQHRAGARHWQEQARAAVDQGREDLARRALARQLEQEDLARGLETQHAEAAGVSAKARAALHALERRLADVRRRQRLLLARLDMARVRVEARRLVQAPEVGMTTARLGRLEQRLTDAADELVAQAELAGEDRELDTALAELRAAARVEEELRRLKGGDAGAKR